MKTFAVANGAVKPKSPVRLLSPAKVPMKTHGGLPGSPIDANMNE